MAVDGIGGMMLRGQLAPQGNRPLSGQSEGGMGGAGGIGTPLVPGTPSNEAPDFGDALERALGRVQAAQSTADTKTMALLTGEDIPVHDVMIAVTEAELAVQMTTAIATKAIQAYQEIWRMDV